METEVNYGLAWMLIKARRKEKLRDKRYMFCLFISNMQFIFDKKMNSQQNKINQ